MHDQHDLAVRSEHRRVNDVPVSRRVLAWTARRLDVVLQEREKIGLPRRQDLGERPNAFVYPGRVRIRRIVRKCIEDVAAHQLFACSVRRVQIGLVHVGNLELGRQQDVRSRKVPVYLYVIDVRSCHRLPPKPPRL